VRGAAAVPVSGWPWTPAIFLLTTLGSSAFLVAREPFHALSGLGVLALGFLLAPRARRNRPPLA
ncbi:MAG: hypothetical protein O3A20_00575, partial [Planctomycetota bacterium]|nr:hypothetical protein [Planctomycetota bacterium]